MLTEFVVCETSGLCLIRQCALFDAYEDALEWINEKGDVGRHYTIEKRYVPQPRRLPPDIQRQLDEDREPFLYDGSGAER